MCFFFSLFIISQKLDEDNIWTKFLLALPPVANKAENMWMNVFHFLLFCVFQAFDQFIFISSSSKKRNTGIEITVSNFFLCFEIHFVRTIMIEWKVKIGFVELDYETKYVSAKSLQKKYLPILGIPPGFPIELCSTPWSFTLISTTGLQISHWKVQ